jgi:hypothetical protein
MPDRIVAAEEADRRPNWHIVRLMRRLTWYEFVLLSMNLDPGNPPRELPNPARRTCTVLSYGINHPPVPRVSPNWSEAQLQRRKEYNFRLAIVDRNRDILATADGRAVDLLKGVAWLPETGWDAPTELLAMGDKRVAREIEKIASRANFKTMEGLKWSEVVMTFTGPEEVRIKARGKSETFTYEAMGFKDPRGRMAKPNKLWDTLLTRAIVTNTSKTLTDTLPPQTNFKHRVSRLRDALKAFFGIEDNPFPYANGYNPTFILTVEEQVIRHARARLAADGEDAEDS